MDLNYNNNQNFCAKYISPASIKAKIGTRWKPEEVNFIRIEAQNVDDIKTLQAVEQLWEGQNCSDEFLKVAQQQKGNANIYALTSQTDNFTKLEADKILGMIDTSALKKNCAVDIYRIGTNPKYAYEQNTRSREKKHIAKELVCLIKKLLGPKGKAIVEFAEASELPFLNRIGLDSRNNGNIYILGRNDLSSK